MKKTCWVMVLLCLFAFSGAARAELTPEVKKALKAAYKTILIKKKGPFTINYCTCVNGELAPVADKNLRVRANPCGQLMGVGQLFCSAYRNDPAKKLAQHGLYVANIFSNEVFLWDKHKDHHRLARGFVLEKFYMETHPKSKLTLSRAYGGISGAEFEVKYAPIFFSKYYALKDWTDFRHYLLQYELQRRFFLKSNMSLINDIRNLSLVVYRSYPPFKPVKDLLHNRLSPGLIPMIEDFQKKHPQDKKNAGNYKKLIAYVKQMTLVDKKGLKEYIPKVSDAGIKQRILSVLKTPDNSPLKLLANLADLVVASRGIVAAKQIRPEEAVELVNLAISANLLIHVTAAKLMEQGKAWSARELLGILRDLMAGSYGAGLMSLREYNTAMALVNDLLDAEGLTIGEMYRTLNRLTRVVEWAQASIQTSFWDVWEPWTCLFPVQHITDDIIRSSPLMAYAALIKSLRGHLLGKLSLEHHVLGRAYTEGVRALNPGLALGPLAFFHDKEEYTRDNILALETTNAELEPVAGIITKDEGNVVSHVQLLARSLGVPNAVFLNDLYKRLDSVKGKPLFYAITPMGRIIVKEADNMDATDKLILAEYEKNKKRVGDGDVKGQSQKLAIDAKRLNLAETRVLGLDKIRRKDSGAICGPKAAFLGELKHHFPDNVVRGAVIPFGVYASHFKRCKVAIPKHVKTKGIAARAGIPLGDFVRKTYDLFFNNMLKNPKLSSTQLAEWIKPRLDIIRHSILQITLDPSFVQALKKELAAQGLFADRNMEVLRGVFVRSDTNVEDMPNFSGAGLNLTIFNLTAFKDVLEGIKRVWASPFTYRSFSWRQSVISDPNLVFPSIVVLESVSSEKSGVLITADVDTGDPTRMTIATAEGVGGTVDGSPAETLLFSQGKALLLAQFKSPTRRMLVLTGRGGSRMVPSTGSEKVLTDQELKALISAAENIKRNFAPEKSGEGEDLPWDIEYGFAKGHLYLFQTRAFAGSSDIRNLPALAALDKGIREKQGQPFSLEEKIRWEQ